MSHSRILSTADQGELLEPDQLEQLEQSFRRWATKAGSGRRLSRARILIIFLLIRYTGAKLNEVLRLNEETDIKSEQRLIRYRGGETEDEEPREAPLSQSLCEEINAFLRFAENAPPEEDNADHVDDGRKHPFAIDPAFVRRKFYERARDCGLTPSRCGPEMIRKGRALELLRNNMPLPVVQRLLGHSTPNLTASHLNFSRDEMRQVAKWYVERESGRKTSARNSFFGKVQTLLQDAVQSLVEIVTPDGDRVRTMVTNSSAERLGLQPGRLVSAEIKAPWLTVEPADRPGLSSADNVYEGVISKIIRGKVNVECEVRIHEGIHLCAILSAPGFDALGVKEKDAVRVLFSCHAVVLHVD